MFMLKNEKLRTSIIFSFFDVVNDDINKEIIRIEEFGDVLDVDVKEADYGSRGSLLIVIKYKISIWQKESQCPNKSSSSSVLD